MEKKPFLKRKIKTEIIKHIGMVTPKVIPIFTSIDNVDVVVVAVVVDDDFGVVVVEFGFKDHSHLFKKVILSISP